MNPMHSWKRTSPQTEQGQSLVELAVILVFMVLLLAGIVDIGRAFYTYIALRDAAQEGVIYGSLFPTACSAIETRVRITSDSPVDMAAAFVAVTVLIAGVDCASATPSQACAGNEIRVRVAYSDFPITMPLLGTFIGTQTIGMSTEAAGVILKPECP